MSDDERVKQTRDELQALMVDALREVWDEFKAAGISVLGQEVGFGDRHGVIRFTAADTARVCANAIAVRAADLEAIVRDLAASEPLYRHCSGSECMLCDGWPGNPDAHNHAESCPWRRARELMSTQPEEQT